MIPPYVVKQIIDALYITPPQSEGYSNAMTIRDGLEGRFNFNYPPEKGGTPTPLYRYETINGDIWYHPLEKAYQGGRWEKAEHAKNDWDRYLSLSPEKQKAKMKAMWGEGETANTLLGLLKRKASFEEMKKAISGLDTWRSISFGEPGD